MKLILSYAKKLKPLAAFAMVALFMRQPQCCIELGEKCGTYFLGAVYYVLLTGYGCIVLGQAMTARDSILSPKGIHIFCAVYLAFVILLVFSPAISACHCVRFSLPEAFSPFWKQIAAVLVFEICHCLIVWSKTSDSGTCLSGEKTQITTG